MITKWFDISYSLERIGNKDLFIFVNHKVAALCWAKPRANIEPNDVVTFDSHRDYAEGVILQQDASASFNLPKEKRCLSSKYNKSFPHFTTSKEFMDWNPHDEAQNRELIAMQHKYFRPINDNFIDVAFMKGLVGNVSCYYLKTENRTHSGICDDVFGRDHFFSMRSVDCFRKPTKKFILDIDLDFFTMKDYESGQTEATIISGPDLTRYLNFMKDLSKQKECVGITVALEPDCCSSEENCLKLCEHFSKTFEKDIMDVAKRRLKENSKNL